MRVGEVPSTLSASVNIVSCVYFSLVHWTPNTVSVGNAEEEWTGVI